MTKTSPTAYAWYVKTGHSTSSSNSLSVRYSQRPLLNEETSVEGFQGGENLFLFLIYLLMNG